MGVFFRSATDAGDMPQRMQVAVAPHIEQALRQPPPVSDAPAVIGFLGGEAVGTASS
jgi:hypothetical protein